MVVGRAQAPHNSWLGRGSGGHDGAPLPQSPHPCALGVWGASEGGRLGRPPPRPHTLRTTVPSHCLGLALVPPKQFLPGVRHGSAVSNSIVQDTQLATWPNHLPGCSRNSSFAPSLTGSRDGAKGSFPGHAASDHTHQASFIRGGGVFWTRPTHPTLDPPTRLWTHPDPPPPYNSVGSIFCQPN